MSWKRIDLYEQSKADPAQHFASPEELLINRTLSSEQKIDLLRRWAYEAEEWAVADEENMVGRDSDLFDRIMAALHVLGVDRHP